MIDNENTYRDTYNLLSSKIVDNYGPDNEEMKSLKSKGLGGRRHTIMDCFFKSPVFKFDFSFEETMEEETVGWPQLPFPSMVFLFPMQAWFVREIDWLGWADKEVEIVFLNRRTSQICRYTQENMEALQHPMGESWWMSIVHQVEAYLAKDPIFAVFDSTFQISIKSAILAGLWENEKNLPVEKYAKEHMKMIVAKVPPLRPGQGWKMPSLELFGEGTVWRDRETKVLASGGCAYIYEEFESGPLDFVDLFPEETGYKIEEELFMNQFDLICKAIAHINSPNLVTLKEPPTKHTERKCYGPRKYHQIRKNIVINKKKLINMHQEDCRRRGTHASPIPHLRRGHYRVLRDAKRWGEKVGQKIWVSDCKVNADKAEVEIKGKTYEVV